MVKNSKFIGQYATFEGSVISAFYNSKITVVNSIFKNNVAVMHGAGIHCINCYIFVWNSVFDSNKGTALNANEVPDNTFPEQNKTHFLNKT